MPDDIYRRTPIVNDSDEHILLNALGGRAVLPGILDRDTNSTLGDTVDFALAESVLPIRAMLNALSGDGKPPPAYRGAKGPDGTRYNLLPGGKPEAGKPQLKVTHEDGVLRIEGSVRSNSELKRLIGRTLAKHGVPLERVEALGRARQEYAPMLSMSVGFTTESARAIAKMACNLFARTFRSEFMSPGFDGVRAFVSRGEGLASDFVYFNALPVEISTGGRAMGPLDHLLLVRANGVDVEAIVAIYEHLQFSVRLGALNYPSKLATAYRVDQIGLDHRLDDRRDVRLPVRSFARVSAASTAQFYHEVREAYSRVLRIVMGRHHAAYEREMIETAITDAWGEPDGQPISEKMWEKFGRLLAERWTDHMLRLGYFGWE